MKEFDFSKKQFDKLSEEAKENFRRQYDGNYADAMEDTAGIVIKDPRPTKTLKSIVNQDQKGTIDINDAFKCILGHDSLIQKLFKIKEND